MSKFDHSEDVRFTPPKADICSAKGHVRFTSESGHVRCKQQCPLLAKSKTLAFFSITGAGRPIGEFGNVNAQLLGGLQVDVQLDFSGLLDWQVGGLLTLENPAGIDSGPTVCIF